MDHVLLPPRIWYSSGRFFSLFFLEVWDAGGSVADSYVCAGGFGGNVGHDPHVLYTLSAVQVLCLFDRLDVLDGENVAGCILFQIFDSLRLNAVTVAVV
jgi:hypothetical protein